MYKENLLKFLQEASNHIKRKDFQKARDIYLGILAEIPGQPDAYYGLYKISYILGDIKQAKKQLKEALLKLSLSVGYDELHKNIFNKWLNEFQKVFKENLFIEIVENSPCLSQIEKFLKQKNLLLAYEKIKNCPLDKKLLVAYFRLARDLGKDYEALYIGYSVLWYVDSVNIWFEVMKHFMKVGAYYDAIKIGLKIINKDEKFYEAYYWIAVIAKYLEYNYAGIIHYLNKALEVNPDYIKAIALLISTYIEIYDLEKANEVFEKYVNQKNLHEFVEYFFDLGRYNIDIDKLKDKIKKTNQIYKISSAITYKLNLGKCNYVCKELIKKLKEVAVLETQTPKIYNSFLVKKSKDFENIVAFHTIGRGGSFFFHSLIDGHKEVATIPGVFLKGFFEPGVFAMIKSPDKKEMIKKFIDIYEAMFDASSPKRVPGDPMGGNIKVGETSGLTTLGENRDIIFKIDKDKFFQVMYKYLKEYKFITQKEFFKLIHLAFEEIRGDNLNKKKLIFYHIHNPAFTSHFRYVNLFSNARDLIMIRNWLQSLESWVYAHVSDFNFEEKKYSNLPYDARIQLLRKVYEKIIGKFDVRLFILRHIFFNSKEIAAVKLEDVKNTPKETMKAVADWMGIEYNDCLLKPEFMGLKFHSNKSKLNPTISEFDKRSIQRKVGVLFSEKDATLLNTVLKPWNETFEYGAGDFPYVSIEQALKMNEEIMDWEKKLIDFFEVKQEDAEKVIKYRKQKLKLALETQDKIFEELKKVKLIKPH